MQAFEIRELGLGGVLDHALRLYRQTFSDCLVAVLAISGPLYVINALLDRAATQGYLSQSGADTWNILVFLVYLILLVPLQYAIVTATQAGTYLGAPVSRQAAFQLARGCYLRLLWVRLVRYLLLLVGLLLVVLPGLWVYVRYFFAEEAIILEDARSGEALGRSASLSREVFGLIVLGSLCFGLGSGLLYFSLDAVAQPLLRLCLEVAVSVLLVPAEQALSCVLYFSARCSGEQFDVELATLRTDRRPEST